MKTIVSTILSAAFAGAAFAQVPNLINYQGRLTDANGDPVTGSKNFSISIYDAETGGNLLYTETIGPVNLDANGVYSFQFGVSGTSNSQITETLATTDDATLVYTKALANTGIVENSITVTDGTNNWSQLVGNPGVGATATANSISGFVIGATITNGGSGYTSPPAVTIVGNGSGATATAVLTEGVVTGITITNAGSGYTETPTITIASPVIPFRVDYSSGTITATYSAAPTAGAAITVSYRYGTNGITGAMSSGAEHWMAVTVDGTPQGTRQRVLAVPFALYSDSSFQSKYAELASGSLYKQILKINEDIAIMSSGMINAGLSTSVYNESFGTSRSSVLNTTLVDAENYFTTVISRGASATDYRPTIVLNADNQTVKCVRLVPQGGALPMHATFHYTDGTNSSIFNNVPYYGIYQANPEPEKLVDHVVVAMTESQGSTRTISAAIYINVPGEITIKIPESLNDCSSFAFFPYTSLNEGDNISAIISGSNGKQNFNIGSTTTIQKAIGVPKSITVNFLPGNDTSPSGSTISGYTLRGL